MVQVKSGSNSKIQPPCKRTEQPVKLATGGQGFFHVGCGFNPVERTRDGPVVWLEDGPAICTFSEVARLEWNQARSARDNVASQWPQAVGPGEEAA